MRMKTALGSRGFSLVEMMISTAIMTVLGIVLVSVFSVSQDTMNQNYQQTNLQAGLRRLLFRMTQEIRESSPNSNPSPPISVTARGISFRIPSTITNAQPAAWTTINYALQDDGTVSRTANGQAEILAGNISALNFTYNPAGAQPRTVSVQITGQRTTPDGRLLTQSVAGQVTLRN